MLRNVRVWFKKHGDAIYISHLDLNRTMLRLIKRSDVSIWYTEGFSPHPYITFPLPLSLGMIGLREPMDLRVTEEISNEEIFEKFKKADFSGIEILEVTDVMMKTNEICFARYIVDFDFEGMKNKDALKLIENIIEKNEEIPVEKKTKAGIKTIDLKEFLKDACFFIKDGYISMNIVLPAGSVKNINPGLIIDGLAKKFNNNNKNIHNLIKVNMYNKEMKVFK